LKHSGLLLLLGLLLLATGARADVSNTATELQPYQRVAGISGNLSSVGSDTMASLMLLWSQEFNRLYPNVNIQLQAPGSSTAPVALIEGTASLAPMSRPMLERELLAFERRHGYPPTAITVAMDALAIFVHQDNPVAGLNLQQLDAIFSATRRCGGKLRIDRWQQLGVEGQLATQPLLLYGRNAVSGTYGFFREQALCRGDFHSRVNEQPGSASVVQSVATALNAIGYSSINYRNASVRVLPLARLGNDYVVPEPDSFIDGRYPLARPLYMYINRPPGQPLHPLVREFLHLVLSREGQEVVLKEGYTPLPASAIARQLGKISDVD
jgi:phosphate transport system substrate-binding protein